MLVNANEGLADQLFQLSTYPLYDLPTLPCTCARCMVCSLFNHHHHHRRHRRLRCRRRRRRRGCGQIYHCHGCPLIDSSALLFAIVANNARVCVSDYVTHTTSACSLDQVLHTNAQNTFVSRSRCNLHSKNEIMT